MLTCDINFIKDDKSVGCTFFALMTYSLLCQNGFSFTNVIYPLNPFSSILQVNKIAISADHLDPPDLAVQGLSGPWGLRTPVVGAASTSRSPRLAAWQGPLPSPSNSQIMNITLIMFMLLARSHMCGQLSLPPLQVCISFLLLFFFWYG